MLVPVYYIKTPSVERLVKIWAERYKPDLSSLLNQEIERLTKRIDELGQELAHTKEQLNQRRNQFGISK